VTQTNLETAPKQLELMHELLPTASVLGLLINPAHQALADVELKDFTAAAHTLRLELRVLNARDDRELENAFADLSQSKVGGLVIGTNTFFTSHAAKLAALATRYAMPAAYKGHEFAAAGGLISYGSDPEDSYRLAGAYTGRVLNGDKPADLPVQQATKVELIINLKTAKALGLSIPLALVGRADEIIE
jgi:putative ABC transport system substrate-binding protein